MRIIQYILGIILCSIGCMFIFLYLNLLTIGYSFFDFIKFISTKLECLLLVVGIILIINSKKGRTKNVLLLRRTAKFSRR